MAKYPFNLILSVISVTIVKMQRNFIKTTKWILYTQINKSLFFEDITQWITFKWQKREQHLKHI